MLDWLLKRLGLDGSFLEHLDQVRIGVQSPSALAIGLICLIPAAWWMARRQARNLATASPRVRRCLTALRVAVLLVLVLVLAGPVARLDAVEERKPLLALVLDHTRSMTLPAGPFAGPEEAERFAGLLGRPAEQAGREELALAALRGKSESLFRKLREKYELRGFVASGSLAAWDAAAFPDPARDPGDASRLGDALAEVLEESGGREVGGIVLLSDGQVTDGLSLADAGRRLSEARAPVFAVPPGGSARTRDVAIVDTFAPPEASKGDTVPISVTVESQGFDGQAVQVRLMEGDTLLDSKEIVLDAAEQQQVELRYRAEVVGMHALRVEIPSPEGEPPPLRPNNSDLVAVRVSDEKLKVLHVEGTPRWDMRFLKNAMRRDHGLKGQAGDMPELVLEAETRRSGGLPDGLPRDPAGLAAYHVVVLGDASPALIDDRFLEALEIAVRERGLGLIVAAGPQYMPHRYDDRLLDLLPVRVDGDRPGLPAPAAEPFRQELTPDGSVHEATRFYDDPARNREIWANLPEYYWCAAAERAGPAATVLVRNPSVTTDYGAIPLIAHHYAGKGKVLFVGTDSTWLWRRYVGERFFATFWGQAIRFVARREDEPASKGSLEVRPLRAKPGERVQIDLRAVDSAGKPLDAPSHPIRIQRGDPPTDVESLDADRDPRTPGRFAAVFSPDRPGDYRALADGRDGPLEARFRVLDTSEEMRRPNLNRNGLAQLSAATGGKLIELDQLDQLPDILKGDVRRVPLRREATIWDNGFVLGLLVILYCLDVAIRRLSGLS